MEREDWLVRFVDAVADGIGSVIPSLYTELRASGNAPSTCDSERFYQFLAVRPLLLRFEGARIYLDKDCGNDDSVSIKNIDIRLEQIREPKRIVAELKRWYTPEGNQEIDGIVADIRFLQRFTNAARLSIVTTMHSRSKREENLAVLSERIERKEPALRIATLPRHVATVPLDDELVIDVIGLAV